MGVVMNIWLKRLSFYISLAIGIITLLTFFVNFVGQIQKKNFELQAYEKELQRINEELEKYIQAMDSRIRTLESDVQQLRYIKDLRSIAPLKKAALSDTLLFRIEENLKNLRNIISEANQ